MPGSAPLPARRSSTTTGDGPERSTEELVDAPVSDPDVTEQQTIQAVLVSLPETQRSALVLRDQLGLSYEDVAAALRKSLPATKVIIHRAACGLPACLRTGAMKQVEHHLARDLLEGYVENSLEAETRSQLEAHLATCEECRNILDSERSAGCAARRYGT